MIRHSVAFSLHHAVGSAEEAAFLRDARILAAIPEVERFEQLNQVSAKSPFRFGFSMEFADDTAYQSYNAHPLHQAFVVERWIPEVSDLQELDYVPLAAR